MENIAAKPSTDTETVRNIIKEYKFVTADELPGRVDLSGYVKESDINVEFKNFVASDNTIAKTTDITDALNISNDNSALKQALITGKYVKYGDLQGKFNTFATNAQFATKSDIPSVATTKGHIGDFLDTEIGKTNVRFKGFTKDVDLDTKFNGFLADEVSKGENGKFKGFSKDSNFDNLLSQNSRFSGLKNTVEGSDGKGGLKGLIGIDETSGLRATIKKHGDRLSTAETTLNGDVNTSGSLLYKIKNNETIRSVLKGKDGANGESAYTTWVEEQKTQGITNKNLLRKANFLASLKGDKGDDGADGDTYTPEYDSDTGEIKWLSTKTNSYLSNKINFRNMVNTQVTNQLPDAVQNAVAAAP